MATASFSSLTHYIRSICPAARDAALLAHFACCADEAAFAEIVRRHGPAVLGVCRRVLRDGHAAEDAFQATFLLLAKKAGSLRRPERLGCWLHGVARRTALKLRGHLARRLTRERPFDETAFVAPDDADADLGPALDAAIEQLPWKYRVPVVLCYLQGLTNAEAAAALGCPANTVATRLARARQRLRGRLAKQGLTAAVSATLVAATARNAAALAAGTAGPSPDIITLMEGVRTAMMWKKVKLVAATVAILTLTGLGATQLGFRAAAQPAGAGVTPMGSEPAPPISVPPATTAPPAKQPERIPAVDLAAPEPASKNFVVTGAPADVANEIALAAEKLRTDFAKMWLGKELPDWPERCPIQVTITEDAHVPTFSTTFQFGSTVSAKNSDSGLSGISWKEYRIGGMKLTGGKGQILLNTLPHEVMHTILADHFRQAIPRWADEGAAALAESTDLQNLHDRQCRDLLAAGSALRLRSLFGGLDPADDGFIPYVQGHSVTRFLVGRSDRSTFLVFVGNGMKVGWDAAAKRFYNFRSLDELEEAWIASLRQRSPKTPPPVAAPIDPPAISPAAPVAPRASDDLPTPPTPPQLENPLPRAEERPPVASELLAPPAAAVAPAALPTGLLVVVASMDKDGMVVCQFAKTTQFQPVTQYRNVAGQLQPYTTFVRRTIQEDHAYKPTELRVIGTDGKPVDEKELAKRLAKETPALFVLNGSYDLKLLSLLKDGTLIISPAVKSGPGDTPPSATR